MRKVFVLTIAVVLSFVFTLLSASVSVSAASQNSLPNSTTKINEFAKSYKYVVKGKTSYGYDWTYKVSTKNVKVTCKYDFKTKCYKFKLTGKKYGLSKVKLMYKKSDTKWVNVTLRIFVDPKKNIMRTRKIAPIE